MIFQQDILEGLSIEQKTVCKARDNIYLTACPGSGKTLVLTRRLAYLASLSPESRKWNIAITFTNRAADEITNRLDGLELDQANIWAGTVHQFCMQFIIRPYSMYLPRLSKGYTIIDEYVQREYGKAIADELRIKLDAYEDPFSRKEVKDAYYARLEANKEIDFDQILEYAQQLVQIYDFICTNIAAVLNSILIDEFQDTNDRQYEILANICRANKGIRLLFVGDVNQAIFGQLGGIAKSKSELEALFDTTFEEYSLTGCYRSAQNVVDFYTSYEIAVTGVTSVASIKDAPVKLSFNPKVTKDELPDIIASIIRSEINNGVPESEICVVAPQWWLLFSITPKLKELLPAISFDAPDISPIKYDWLNPFYLLARLVFTESGQTVSLRKRVATELLSTLRDDYKIPLSEGIDNYDILKAINISIDLKADGIVILQNCIKAVLCLLKIQLDHEQHLNDMYLRFFAKIQDRVQSYGIATDYASISKFFKERDGVVLSTIHGIKGEEYTTVIAFALLNGYLPYWDYIMKNEMKSLRLTETQKLLYVLCSRAKKNIYLYSETGHKTKNGKDYSPTDELLAGIKNYEATQQVAQ
jgi:superfamily I DNA/RNA helicase